MQIWRIPLGKGGRFITVHFNCNKVVVLYGHCSLWFASHAVMRFMDADVDKNQGNSVCHYATNLKKYERIVKKI